MTYLCANSAVQQHEPIDVAACFAVAVLIEQPCKFEFGTVESLPGKLNGKALASTLRLKVEQDIPYLGVEQRIKNRQSSQVRVKSLQTVCTRAEQILKEVGRHLSVQPKKQNLSVVDKISTAFFDRGESSADCRGHLEMASLVRETFGGLQIVQ